MRQQWRDRAETRRPRAGDGRAWEHPLRGGAPTPQACRQPGAETSTGFADGGRPGAPPMPRHCTAPVARPDHCTAPTARKADAAVPGTWQDTTGRMPALPGGGTSRQGGRLRDGESRAASPARPAKLQPEQSATPPPIHTPVARTKRFAARAAHVLALVAACVALSACFERKSPPVAPPTPTTPAAEAAAQAPPPPRGSAINARPPRSTSGTATPSPGCWRPSCPLTRPPSTPRRPIS